MKTMAKIGEQTGAAAVEFAVVLPALILLLFGTIEFGLLFYNEQILTNASREGARAGIVSQAPRVSDAEISAVVTTFCAGNLVTFGASNDPIINCSRTGNSFQDDLTVQVTYNYAFLVLSSLGFDQKTLSAQTIMKME